MDGTRKWYAWLLTEVVIVIIFGIGVFKGIEFKSNDLTTIILIASALSGAFFGANFGEHYAKTKLNKSS